MAESVEHLESGAYLEKKHTHVVTGRFIKVAGIDEAGITLRA
jgi:hypothetical protein